ncbi:hypothetical protein [Arthrobacter sp. TMN-50]
MGSMLGSALADAGSSAGSADGGELSRVGVGLGVELGVGVGLGDDVGAGEALESVVTTAEGSALEPQPVRRRAVIERARRGEDFFTGVLSDEVVRMTWTLQIRRAN